MRVQLKRVSVRTAPGGRDARACVVGTGVVQQADSSLSVVELSLVQRGSGLPRRAVALAVVDAGLAANEVLVPPWHYHPHQ